MELEQKCPFAGYEFYATDMIMPDDLQAEIAENGIIDTMRKDPFFRNKPDHEVMAAFERGEMRYTMAGETKLVAKNKLVNNFFTDLFALYAGTPTANQTLEMLYLAIGTRYGVAHDDAQTSLVNEFFRGAATQRFNDGYRKFYFARYLLNTEANPPGATTIDTGTFTVTSFDVVSAASININDRVQIYTSANGLYNEVTITGKSSNTLSVAIGALSVAPVAGDTVIPMHGEIGILAYPSTGTPSGSDKLIDRAVISQLKTTAAGKLYNCVFNHLAV